MASGDQTEKAAICLGERALAELFVQATADHEAGRLQPALEAYARILDQDDKHAAALIYVADIYLKYERIVDARLVLDHLLKLHAAAFQGEGLSDICLAFARIWGAEQRELTDRLLARAVEVWPDLPEANEAVAARLAEGGDYRRAAAYYRHALKLAPGRAEIWYRLALVCIEAEDSAAALGALLEVLDLEPGHSEAVRKTIVVVDQLEDGDLGAHFLRRLTELIEEDGEALAYIGFKLLAGQHFDGALSAFARAADLDLGSYETLIGATTAAHALGEAAATEAYWEQALAAMPGKVEVWLEMARTFAPDLPPALTRQLIDGAAAIVARDAKALCDVVEVAIELGQREAAKAILALALSVGPDSRRARALEAALTGRRR